MKHPKVLLDLALTDRMSDPVAKGWDIVVRVGALPPDSEMTVRKLCDLRLDLYASPEYLKRKGPVNEISELLEQEAVVVRGPSGQLRPWFVFDGSTVREITVSPAIVLADGQAFTNAAINGFGIAQIIDRVAQPHVDAGRLIHVLPAADIDGPPVHAIIPLGRRMAAKTRVVLNALVQALK